MSPGLHVLEIFTGFFAEPNTDKVKGKRTKMERIVAVDTYFKFQKKMLRKKGTLCAKCEP